jgi:hypothetical protein
VPSHLYLVKHNDQLVSHCACATAEIAFPPQLQCPWCGCGWLFSCIECRKAFTFARAIETNEPWEALARRDLINYAKKEPEPSEVEHWVDAMRELHADVVVGQTYVCLDGVFIRTDATALEFAGWHAHHSLDVVPQVAALSDRSIITSLLASREYWTENALEGRTLH